MTSEALHSPSAPDAGDALPAEVWQQVADDSRRSVLHELQMLDTVADPDFDRLTKLAADLLGAPIAMVSLVDLERQWFKSCIGVDATETPVSLSFCAHAITAGNQVMVVPDATRDPRFADNALVTGPHHLRFYAGAPIVVRGARIGTLCVLDTEIRDYPTEKALDQLRSLADLASSFFELKDSTRTGALARVALAREEKRRAIAVEAAGLASWVWDLRTDLVECDVSLTQLFGLAPATQANARHLIAAIDPRDEAKIDPTVSDTLTFQDEFFGEYRVRSQEPPRWLAARGRVIERDAAGKPTLLFGVNYDITERKAGEQRQHLLLRELNHRVKNTLATVQALATQTVRHAREPRDFLEAFNGRLQALGLAHGLLSDHEWRGLDIDDLVKREIGPFEGMSGSRIRVTGENVLLTPDQALGLGLVLHELGSNATKYGALSVPGGHVDLDWRVDRSIQGRRLDLHWSESGGPIVTSPTRQGFGSILIQRSLTKVLTSDVSHEFRPEGVTARITFPLETFEDQ